MKTLSIYVVLLFSIFNTQFSFAQIGNLKSSISTANIKVWGNCESCKKRIETAAKKAGATAASWNEETKNLTVSFDGTKTSTDKIEQAIIAKGHDTENFSAAAKAYNNLPGCCQYERKVVATEVGTGKDKKCNQGKSCCKKSKAS